jgi:hypothetical protein
MIEILALCVGVILGGTIFYRLGRNAGYEQGRKEGAQK